MKQFLYILLLLPAFTLQAQKPFPYLRADSIDVIKFGVPLANPWAGGLNTPNMNAIDLNFDGVKDLAVFDSHSGNVKTYINNGISGTASYTYAPEYEFDFPRSLNLENFMLLRDFNCDGLEDLFTYRLGGLALYKNTGSSATGHTWSKEFDYLPAIIFNQPSGVYCSPIDIPSIEDIDNDGDLDIISTEVGGVIFYLYENKTTDCDTMVLERQNGCWGSFYESPLSDSLIFNAACKGGGGGNPNRHAGSTILATDLNGDGAVELLLGDIESERLVAVNNSGSSINAQMTSADYSYPSSTISVALKEFNAAYYLDINNDNTKDLIVTPSNNLAADIDNVWQYQNNGTTSNPNFSFVRKNFLTNSMVDLGKLSYPELVDVDNDGLLDLVVGGLGYFQDYDPVSYIPEFKSGLAYFRNTGDSITPEFTLISEDFLSLSSENTSGFFQTMGDLDADGDLDLIAGNANGYISFYENTASSGNPIALTLVDTNYMRIKNGAYATPRLIDINGDTLLDLIIGESNGILNYHQNIGTASNPQFDSVPTTDTLGGIHFFNPYLDGFINAYFASPDSTGNLFAFVGTQEGTIYIYDSISQNLNAGDHFHLVDSIVTNAAHVSPALANINFSDSLEIIVGEAGGGLSLWGRSAKYIPPPIDTNDTDTVGDTTFIHEIYPLLQQTLLFPNPAQDQVQLAFSGIADNTVQLSITDVTGRVYVTKSVAIIEQYQTEVVSVKNLNNGLYFMTINLVNDRITKQLIIHK